MRVGNHFEENAVWSYETPFDEGESYAGYLAFYWKKMDQWLEEDEEIFIHARNPYKRIDAIQSSRPVRVVLGGETVAESSQAHFLFETGMPTRYYIPTEDVRMDLLAPTETKTGCPYKGSAVYWSAEVGGEKYEDIVWSYPEPLPEVHKIAGLVCFYNEKVDDIFVDGEVTVKPEIRVKKKAPGK